MTVTPPFAYYGGETRIAGRIAELLPDHAHYVEPFASGLSVLLAKAPSRMETVNDLDSTAGRCVTKHGVKGPGASFP